MLAPQVGQLYIGFSPFKVVVKTSRGIGTAAITSLV